MKLKNQSLNCLNSKYKKTRTSNKAGLFIFIKNFLILLLTKSIFCYIINLEIKEKVINNEIDSKRNKESNQK